MKDSDFAGRVEGTVARRAMLLSGERVGVAVSGGPDSVALLHLLRELAPRLGVTLGVVHLDHQLRGRESDLDREFVAKLGRGLGLEADVRSFAVASAAAAAGGNLEQAARSARYEFFRSLIDGGRYDKIAVGHTRNDQAETVLFRLLRGSGSAGLAGIRPVLGRRIVRPLIELTRKDVMAYLARRGLAYRIDSSNFDTDRARNRIRRDLLPRLERDWNPHIVQTLANTAEWARAEEEEWTARLPALARAHLNPAEDGLSFHVDSLRPLSLAVTRRLLRRAIEEVRGDLLGIGFDHVESLRRLTESPRGAGRLDLPGLHVERSFGEVRLRPAFPAPTGAASYDLDVDAPGSYAGPWGASLVILRLHDRENAAHGQGYNGSGRELLDWKKLPRPLRLRNWRPGDRFHPAGRLGSRKLKSMFQEKRIPAWRRRSWPVLSGAVRAERAARPQGGETNDEQDQEIVWARAFGPSARFAAEEESRVLLEIREVARGEVDFWYSAGDAARLIK